MGRKLRADQHGVFPGFPDQYRHRERDNVVRREMARRAGLPSPERHLYHDLGNPNLPIKKHKDEIQCMVRDHQISMLEGATGSGKSTQIAQYALEMGYQKIVYLEPRVLLADDLCDRLQSELCEQLGLQTAEELIGVRHSERSTGIGKQIEVMTPATFMRVMDELEPYADEPVLIIGDEIHEKDFETELAVASSVQKLNGHPKWRLVLASATLDAESIRQAYTAMNGRDVPRVLIEGRPHDLLSHEEEELDPIEAYAKYGKDHQRTMIFTAGKAEIKEIIQGLRKLDLHNVRIDKLHAKLPYEDIRRAIEANLRDGERQIIVSTSAGQSGITIPGLTLVISDGTTRRPDLDADATPGLFKERCAQDELTQQAGRAGRDVAGGEFVLAKPVDPLFGFVSKKDRETQAPAQIYHTNISRNVLLTSSFDTDFYNLNKFLIHKVTQRTILEAYEVLYRLSAHDDLNRLTETGKAMNKFPLRPELSRTIVAAMQEGASMNVMQHLVAIVSTVEAGGLPYFERGVGEDWRRDIREETSDDYIAQLDMFYATRDSFDHSRIDELEMRRRNYDPKNAYRAHKTFDKIMRALGLPEYDIDVTPPTFDEEEAIRDYLTAGLFDFAHKRVVASGSKVPEFMSLHERYEPIPRQLSSRGTYRGRDQLVLGMPRRFEKHSKGVLVEHSVIENVLPTTKQKLARHVLHLLERKTVASSKVVGGHLKRTDELYFGDLKMDEVDSISRLSHTTETKQQLREAAYRKPTQALDELITIKRELEDLVRITPIDRLNEFFPNGIITSQWLDELMDELIDGDVDSIYALDNKIRTRMVLDTISIDNWISRVKQDELRELSPPKIEIVNGVWYYLNYSHGKPYIKHFNLLDIDLLPDDGVFLADGRQVLINYRMGPDTKKYTAGAIKQYAAELDGSLL